MAMSYPPDVSMQAGSVLEAWKKIDPVLKFGALDQAALQADLTQATALQASLDALDA
jgi:hypothetical protein